MSTHNNEAVVQPGYFINPENAAEMARLTKQAQTVSKYVGLLPATIDLSTIRTVLDIACGPGAWALELAARFPDKQITGIDTSNIMINYANYSAQAQNFSNAHFLVADATQPLPFPDACFDLINTRYIIGFMHTTSWPSLFKECLRILRPGGTFCNCEPESLGSTNSPALARYNLLFTQALRNNGQCFSTEGDQIGIAAVQARQFIEAGFDNVQQDAYVINYSAGQPAYEPTYDNFKTFLKLLQAMIVHSNAVSQQEIDTLYTHVLEEMQADAFCAVGFFQRVWGQKPVHTTKE